jgi:hypothetical protein
MATQTRTFTHIDRQRFQRAAELCLEDCYRRKQRVPLCT